MRGVLKAERPAGRVILVVRPHTVAFSKGRRRCGGPIHHWTALVESVDHGGAFRRRSCQGVPRGLPQASLHLFLETGKSDQGTSGHDRALDRTCDTYPDEDGTVVGTDAQMTNNILLSWSGHPHLPHLL